MDLMKLKGKETGERLDLKLAYKWLINELPYNDFANIFKISGMHNGNMFSYRFCIDEKSDTPKTREDYLKYLMYKIYQNSNTDGVTFI